MWQQAARLAEQTPDTRNRYVDFLRAVSILMVVLGHWLIAAPHVTSDGLQADHMLAIAPWTQWLTWVFQVMPVFFIVGGYSNGTSWESARRRGVTYGVWLRSRLRRLAGPVLPLLVAWVVIAVGARAAGVPGDIIKIGSQIALVPVWFLAVYIGIAVLAPLAHWGWRRFGMASFWGPAAVAVLVDLLVFGLGWRAWGWTNYLWVWLAVHQLGFAWRAGKLAGARRSLPWAVAGLAGLLLAVFVFEYPLSMVGVPGEEVTNTLPPTVALLALGMLHLGLLLTVEAAAGRWLRRSAPWTGVVLINGMIMTIYLWHLTVMALVIGAAVALGGIGLRLEPGSAGWWVGRIPWVLVLTAFLVPFLLGFLRYERSTRRSRGTAALPVVVGASVTCTGLALLALNGLGADGPLGVNWLVVALPFVGALLSGQFSSAPPGAVGGG